MDDEFKLCWKNFQDNIASGFQNLYDRGDLVDVTLACDGKLLHAHKIVLAICSPYFQEIFLTNPCKHPIIILKDVHFNIMCELLEFMYQGVVNVKHTELQSFMKIGQLLQIKGLATNSSAAPAIPEKSLNRKSELLSNICSDSVNSENVPNEVNSSDIPQSSANNTCISAKNTVFSPPSSPTPITVTNQQSKCSPDNTALHHFESSSNLKRHLEGCSADVQSIYQKKLFRRSGSHMDQISDQNDENEESLEHVNPEDFFLSTIPHISMGESRYDLNSVKREGGEHIDTTGTSSSMRNSFGSSFGFEYNLYKNSSCPNIGGDFSSDMNMPNDYSKNFGNHMDIPPIAPGEHWFQGKLEFMLSQRGKPLLVHDGHTFGIQYVRKDKKYWQCNLSRKFNCKARVTTTDTGEIIVTNNEHCHTEIRQHLRKDYQRNKVMMNALINLSSNRFAENMRRQSFSNINTNLNNIQNFSALVNNSLLEGPSINVQSKIKDDSFEHSTVDLSGSELSSALTKTENVKNIHTADNTDELPLDCGMRSLRNENKSESSPGNTT